MSTQGNSLDKSVSPDLSSAESRPKLKLKPKPPPSAPEIVPVQPVLADGVAPAPAAFSKKPLPQFSSGKDALGSGVVATASPTNAPIEITSLEKIQPPRYRLPSDAPKKKKSRKAHNDSVEEEQNASMEAVVDEYYNKIEFEEGDDLRTINMKKYEKQRNNEICFDGNIAGNKKKLLHNIDRSIENTQLAPEQVIDPVNCHSKCSMANCDRTVYLPMNGETGLIFCLEHLYYLLARESGRNRIELYLKLNEIFVAGRRIYTQEEAYDLFIRVKKRVSDEKNVPHLRYLFDKKLLGEPSIPLEDVYIPERRQKRERSDLFSSAPTAPTSAPKSSIAVPAAPHVSGVFPNSSSSSSTVRGHFTPWPKRGDSLDEFMPTLWEEEPHGGG